MSRTPAPQPPPDDELLTLDEVAAHLKVPAATLRKWRAQRSGPAAFRLGKHLRYRRSAVESFLRDQEAREQETDDWRHR
jgi:excisionase family DNA binding protein